MDSLNASSSADDLSALAWVNEEIRKSLESAHKSLNRVLKAAQSHDALDAEALDPAVLRAVRQQLHQGIGALELAGLPGGALLLRASESLVQKVAAKPQNLTEPMVSAIEAASFALLDLMRRRLAGKQVSAMALFPQYERLTALAGGGLARPSDLWSQEWHAPSLDAPVELPAQVDARQADAQAVNAFESALLGMLKTGQTDSARALVSLCSGLAVGASARHAHREASTWTLAAGFLEALADGRLTLSVHVKRVLSALLGQLRTLAREDGLPSDRLAQELLFFCAQAHPLQAGAPEGILDRLRRAFRLDTQPPVDLSNSPLGRFDPAWVVQAAKRVNTAKDGWSAVAGGELFRLAALTDQFAAVAESVEKLYPHGQPLARALLASAQSTVQSGAAPEATLAMEVATALLYLDASLEEGEFEKPQERQRVNRLAERIESARSGGAPQPLEGWMEDLYREVSDRQTIGSVVQELRSSLGECEKQIDQFFRDPTQTDALRSVPSQLQSMKGVLSVLGLDSASQALTRMRQDIESLLLPDADLQQAAEAGVHDRLASNLGALGFLVDMLAVQPQLAKTLFRFEEDTGVLAPIMGRARAPEQSDVDPVEALAQPAVQQDLAHSQEVAQSLADAAALPDTSLEALSDSLQSLGDLPAVQEQPALAASLAQAQAAVEQASASDDVALQNEAREQVVAALNDFVQSVSEPASLGEPLPVEPVVEPAPAPLMPVAAVVAPPQTGLEEDDEMREIFLEEAREVVETAREAVASLHDTPASVELLTTVRRAFHTLKGSSRMVGLKDFGEAGWACEQLYNAWLAAQTPASVDLLSFTQDALNELSTWVDDIAARRDAGRSPSAIVTSADALRLEGRLLRIADVVSPEIPAEIPAAMAAEVPAEVPSEATLSFDLSEVPVEAGAEAGVEAVEVIHQPHEVMAETDAPALPEAFESLDTVEFVDVPEVLEAPEGLEVAEVTEAPDVIASFEAADLPLPDADVTGLALDDAGETTPATPLDLIVLDLSDDGSAAHAEGSPTLPQPTAIVEEMTLSEFGALSDGLTADLAEPLSEAQFSEQVIDVPLEEETPAPVLAAEDEQVKVIGHLRIGIPLFNIYLNEADEQSRRLCTALAEWALELHRPVGDVAVALAHSLAGNSGTVGYADLSKLARALEHALERSCAAGQGDAATAELFAEAAEEIRRLLHQFAAGFLKSPDEGLLDRLEQFDPQPVSADVGARHHLRLVHSADELSAEPADAGFIEPEAPVDLTEPVEDVSAPIEPVPASPTPAAQALGALGVSDIRAFEAAPVDVSITRSVTGDADVDLGEDADIDVIDAIDVDLFPIFEEEAQELLPQLADDVRAWRAEPSRRDLGTACMRTLHTFKGGARLAGAMRLGELAHRMESAVERMLMDDSVTADQLDALENRSDILAEVFASLQRRDLRAQQAEDARVAAIREAALLAAEAVQVAAPAAPVASVAITPELPVVTPATSEPDLALPATEGLAELPDSLTQALVESAAADVEPSAPASPVSHTASPIDWSSIHREFRAGAAGNVQDATSATAMVRVKPRLLDRLVNQAGEVSIARSRLSTQLQQMRGSVGDLTDNLERLRQQLRDIELQAETQMGSRLEAARAAQASFDPLEFDRYTRFQELTRMMAESVNDVATVQRGLIRSLETAEDQLAAQFRLTRELQDDLLRTRMVEFDGLSDRLYRVVRQAAKETGKQVRLDIAGGQTEVDRGVLDRMAGAFEHLLRNCVTHGIEKPEVRTANGKEAAGAILVAVRQEGNEISIEFRDDGAGLNLQRIRQKAEGMGLIQPGAEVPEGELAQLIFTPGFSTAETVSELAGRGIGMDVVRSDVNAMGGRIETSTAAGQGTSFRLVLPLTTAVTKVVMVRCGELVVSIPTGLVEMVRRVKHAELEQAYQSGALAYGDLSLPFFWFGALLQSSPRGSTEGRSLPVVIIRSAQQRVALHVDEVLGNADAVVKNLGPQLSRVPGLAGMTLLASGAVALIYNPVALATVYGVEAQAWTQRSLHQVEAVSGDSSIVVSEAAQAPQAPLVLVVDDSLTVRRVTQRLLTREGYRVTLAKDGLDALEKIAEETPCVVLSDIEMPRMDGFDLARNLRGDERWAKVPIVMITSRIAQKHRDYAMELGVDHYLGKPYSEEELVGLVARYAHAAETQGQSLASAASV